MASQSIRPSQFITTFGPGSILEGPEGPRIVLTLDKSKVFGGTPIYNYEIPAGNMSSLLPPGSRIVRLPTNADRQVQENIAIYNTNPFPGWSLCVEHNKLYQYHYGNLTSFCPDCQKNIHSPDIAEKKARRESIRFVCACPDGHLDDVNWKGIIRHNRSGCNPTFLNWEGGGSSLASINIRCPGCNSHVNLGYAYNQQWPCSGRFPEREVRNECKRSARITQRGAANLYVSDILSVLTIPRLHTALHQALANQAVLPLLHYLKGQGPLTGQLIRSAIIPVAHLLPPQVINVITRNSDHDILIASTDVLLHRYPSSQREAKLEEFEQLQRAATFGHPASPRSGEPPQFEVISNSVRSIKGPKGRMLRVTPVSRLQVVMVQQGYQRIIESNNSTVDISFSDGGNRWYPGVKLYGEGIFIDLAPEEQNEDENNYSITNHFELDDEDSSRWRSGWGQSNPPDDSQHPVFIWWHTLSHRLIRALSIDSGYSSASIRERIYIKVDGDSVTGGILLFTAQPGGDGTLGGLIALVPQFQKVMNTAFKNIDACSNDPLCGDTRFQAGRSNGAVCYACGFVSETSCEYRNTSLDRNVLQNNLP